MRLDVATLHDLVTRILAQAGMSSDNAAIVAGVVVAAERDGTISHGLFRMPGYLATLRSGWVDGHAVPTVTQGHRPCCSPMAATASPRWRWRRHGTG